MADLETGIFNEQLPLICKIKIGDKVYYVKDNDARSIISDLAERVSILEQEYEETDSALSAEIARAKAAEQANTQAIQAIAIEGTKVAAVPLVEEFDEYELDFSSILPL